MVSNATRTLATDRAAGKMTVPAEALTLVESSPLALAAGEDGGKLPVKMRARGGQPLNHWYWGLVAHDMAGFTPADKTIPVDYCHNYDEVLGFLNKFEATNDGLDVSGELVSFTPQDRTAEVAHKSKLGVPYQASIFFEAQAVEEVMPGAEADVNGYKLKGPAVVVRKWSLRGVAVCPYGYDPKTSTKLSAGLAGEIPLEFTKELEMSKPADKPAEKPAENTAPQELAATPPAATPAPAAPASDPRAEFAATLQKFTAKFGAENGAKWAAEGLSYEQALEKHADLLANQLSASQAESKQLNEKLAALPRGEADPVSFASGDKHEGGSSGVDPSHLKFKLGDNLAKVAAGIKLPAKK